MAATKWARELAARAWCQPATRSKVMDVDLAEAVAELLDELGTDLAVLWAVVANVSGGDWSKQAPEWQGAAARARDRFHASLGGRVADCADPADVPAVVGGPGE